MDVFARLQQNDPALVEIDQRQLLHVRDFYHQLAGALLTNTQLRRIVFCPSTGNERWTRDRLLAHALEVNPCRPSGSSWVEADDPHGENIYCRLHWSKVY